MPFFELQPHVTFGLVGARPVFLDLARDRYLALEHRLEDIFRCLDDGSIPVAGTKAEALLKTGLFRLGTAPGRLAAASVRPPGRSLLDSPLPRPRLLTAARTQLLTMRARRRLRSTPLRDILATLRARRADARAIDDPARCAGHAADFLAARMMVPSARSCLPDALALLDWLAPHASFPTLVFGVKLHPFKAHCWVQADGLLLTDSVDAVAEFTPVLVTG